MCRGKGGKALYLFGAFLRRGVVDIHLDILSVIAEGFTKDGEAAHMLGVIVYSQPETQAAPIVQMEAVDGHIGNFQTVDKSSLPIDYEEL